MSSRAGRSPYQRGSKHLVNLPKQRLGHTDLDITRLGLGTSAMGGPNWADGWGPQDDTESEATILRAVELGINWIDTAPVYGLGHAESLVGRVLKRLPPSDRPMIFTKCGLLWDDSRPEAGARRTLRPETLRRELEQSLGRLQVDALDLYQIHQPPSVDSSPLEDCWLEMTRLVEEGLVRAIGVSNFSTELLIACARARVPDTLQPLFSLLHREVARSELDWCAAHGTGVIVYRPLQSGLLTSRFHADSVVNLPAGDWRREDADFQEPWLGRHLSVRDALRSIAARHRVTVEAVAIAWTLSWKGVTGAIVGARSSSQVDTWLDAGTLELDRGDFDELALALRLHTLERGPVHPLAEAG
jgi:aryl-alcohol dehydrogenase-like predicted oxidoreductase